MTNKVEQLGKLTKRFEDFKATMTYSTKETKFPIAYWHPGEAQQLVFHPGAVLTEKEIPLFLKWVEECMHDDTED